MIVGMSIEEWIDELLRENPSLRNKDELTVEILAWLSSAGYLGDKDGKLTAAVEERRSHRNPSLLREYAEDLEDLGFRTLLESESRYFRGIIIRDEHDPQHSDLSS